jgi:hypothetical protein
MLAQQQNKLPRLLGIEEEIRSVNKISPILMERQEIHRAKADLCNNCA